MAHGFPDWGEYAPQALVEKSLDVAELAARLGSPCLYDRRGTVIFYDDFSTGLIKWTEIIGGNLQIIPTAKMALLGGYSLLFFDDGSFTFIPSIQVSLPFVTQTPIGAEGGFCFTSVYSQCHINFALTYNGYLYEYWFIYDRNAKTVKIKIEDGSFPTIASNIEVPIGNNRWFTMKLVVNPLTGKYERGRFNNQIIDLSGYDCYKVSSTDPDEIVAGFGLGRTSVFDVTNYLGFVVVTQNE